MFNRVLVHTITNVVNHSFISGQFHPTLKKSVISPLLKKPTLDNEELSNYRPISNLSIISKLIEPLLVKSRIMDHLSSKSILTNQLTANIILLKQLFCTSIVRQCNRITESILTLLFTSLLLLTLLTS